jgi:hypothetical protein
VAAAGYGRLCDLLPREMWPAVKRAELLSRLGDEAALRPALEEFLERAHAALRTDLVGELAASLEALGAAAQRSGRSPAPEVRAA